MLQKPAKTFISVACSPEAANFHVHTDYGVADSNPPATQDGLRRHDL